MLQHKIREAFCASISLNPKGYQYLHTRDFVRTLQEKGIHFSGREANQWIESNQTYFVDKTTDGNENRLWMMAEMERELIVERTRAGLAAECWRTVQRGSRWLM
ncbi:hypothetical protein OZ909_08830 [Klebsiella quasipneumoniae subsp. quasipneumoniae]